MTTPCRGRLGRWLPLLVLLAAGCDPPGKPDPSKRPVAPEREMNFAVLYGRNCAGCHGKDGATGPAPPLNDDLFRASISEEELRDVIAGGRYVTKQQKTLMPGFAKNSGGMLTPVQIEVLVHEIKGIRYKLVEKSHGDEPTYKVKKDRDGQRPLWGDPGPKPKDAPDYSVKKSKAGRTSQEYERIRTTIFKDACASCHGKTGEGGDSGALNDPAFLALISDQALRRIVITGRPDLAGQGEYMPGYSKERGRDRPLTGQEVDDLVELLAHWRKAGESRSGSSTGGR